jgi:hypothetical protein
VLLGRESLTGRKSVEMDCLTGVET